MTNITLDNIIEEIMRTQCGHETESPPPVALSLKAVAVKVLGKQIETKLINELAQLNPELLQTLIIGLSVKKMGCGNVPYWNTSFLQEFIRLYSNRTNSNLESPQP